MNKNRKGGKSLKDAGHVLLPNLARAKAAHARAASNAARPIPSGHRKTRTQQRRIWLKEAA